jgi:tRNA(Ile)-lysidine synthase
MITLAAFRTIMSLYHNNNTPLVIAVSGGPDSMGLLHLCIQTIPQKLLVVAHFDHQLRKEGRKDAMLVETYCVKHHLRYEYGKASVASLAKQEKRTLEEMGRIKRYQFLRQVKEKYQATHIVTAHHLDDQVETILLHLIRGSGLHGLTGMDVCSKDILRPLLSYRKQDIIDYCQKNKVPYRIDTTNKQPMYTRNIIRLKILPLMEKINPQVSNNILKTARQLKDIEDYLKHEASHFLNLPSYDMD